MSIRLAYKRDTGYGFKLYRTVDALAGYQIIAAFRRHYHVGFMVEVHIEYVLSAVIAIARCGKHAVRKLAREPLYAKLVHTYRIEMLEEFAFRLGR